MGLCKQVILPVLFAYVGYVAVQRRAVASYIGPSGYGFSTMPAEVLADQDLTGVVVLITGANAGLGFESAREMAQRGAHIVVSTRSAKKSQETIEKLQELVGREAGAQFTPLECDLSDLNSVTMAAEQFLASGLPLHVLMNNAGIMALPTRQVSKQGFEMQMGTNHIGHFHLTNLLLPKLLDPSTSERRSRIVAVASSTHNEADTSFLANATLENSNYHYWTAYCNTKFANVLFAKELHERYFSQGLLTFSLHPGVASTEIGRSLSNRELIPILWNYPAYKTMKSVSACTSTQVFAATQATSQMSGRYLEDGNDRSSLRADLQAIADDADARKAFWDTTQSMVDAALK
ncbi:unnamed protein product [Polarella glacialis]|uniref:Protochlorophyllide reductase n=1 Tax=Polarella glacialis TaxID=89957 RepID=A0A813FHZ3_POLGL|nr:unnamed protein product [Polarella glacialis]